MGGKYLKRIQRAKRRHPDLFEAGSVIDMAVQHDEWCNIYGESECSCFPDITLTTKAGRYSVDGNGKCRKLGFEAESIPILIDPRKPDLN